MKRHPRMFRGVSLAVLLAATGAAAQERTFDVPAGPAANSIPQFARQAGVQIIAPAGRLKGIVTPAVKGRQDARAALRTFLASTHLEVAADNGAVIILREAERPPVGPASDAPAAAPVEEQAQLTEVIVTAARQTQNLQKVSAAVQVVDGAELRRQAVSNIAQVFQSTPSVQVTAQPGGFSIDIRGQGGDMPSGSTQGSVALEFDGVYSILSQSSTVGFFDVDRVEVLPGPQSTRYGPNADGGVVNVITKDPVLSDSSGAATVTVGNYGLVRGEAAQNIALGDKAALRISGAAIHRDAYVKPIGSNAVGQSVRAKLLFEPTDDLTLKLAYQYDHIGGTGAGVEPYTMTKVAPYSGDSINDASDPWKLGDYSTNGVTSDSNKADITQQTLTANLGYRLGEAAVFDVISSYTKVTGEETACYAGGPPWIIGGAHDCYQYYQFAPFHQFSTEARLHSAPGADLVWNLGVYHFDYTRQTYNSTPNNVPTGEIGGSLNATTTNAVFGEVTYPVTERARLIVGARQSYDKRELRPAGIADRFSRKLHHFDYRLGGEFDVTPTSMAYATVSTGYRPGGLTGYDTTTAAPYEFKSEVNTAFELGSKNRFLDNRLQVNADLFYYKQDSYQNIDSYHGFVAAGETTACHPGDARPACSLPTFNLAAQALGFETQIRFSPTRADTFGLNATWLDAKFDKSQGTCATIAAPGGSACWIGYNDQSTDALLFFDVAGAVQPHSPKFAGTATYRHTFTFASGAAVGLGGEVFYSGGYWVHPVQDAAKFGWQPAYMQGGLNASFTPADGPWSLNAYVRNVTNYAVKQSTLPITAIGDPRTFGLTLSTRW
jgi:iron complex outermembrane receptor protein